MTADLNSQTPAGVLAYCEYLMDKGYASAAQVNPWRTAIQRVFETVEGADWESTDLTTINLDEYAQRFQTLAGAQYKAESITAYKRRVSNAIDAHKHYLKNGRPPTFKRGGSRPKEETALSAPQAAEKPKTVAPPAIAQAPGMITLTFPLDDGRLVTFLTPPRMKPDDVNRLCAFLRTLQDDGAEVRQIPRQTGEARQAA